MSYEFIPVPKSAVPGSGAAKPKDPNVAIFRNDDVLVWPLRDSKGVRSIGDFIMKPGKTPIYIYMTGVNQQPGYSTEGEVDAEQIMQKFVATHPGDELDAHEFFQNNLGVDLTVVYGSCADDSKRIYGTKCSPLRLKNEFKNDKEGAGHTFTFDQIQGTRFVPSFWTGNIPYSVPTATDVTIDMLVANGYQYKVEALDTTAAISLSDFDLVHGDVVSLIGSGGADPATLSAGDLTEATVILKDGTAWTALENATISFEVVDGGSTMYLIERNRS